MTAKYDRNPPLLANRNTPVPTLGTLQPTEHRDLAPSALAAGASIRASASSPNNAYDRYEGPGYGGYGNWR